MKPIYLKPDQIVVFVAMKDEPTIFPFGPIAELIAVGKRPFIVGEICYVREAWLITDLMNKPITKNYKGELWVFKGKPDIDMKSRVIYQADHPGKWKGAWRSPVTMPQWASRRHVRIVSCEPIQQDGKWKWRVEAEEVKA